MSDVNISERIIAARDGFNLHATEYGDGERVVLINSATAVPRRFYRHFAQALAQAGFRVLTYDYRGIGDSRPARLRGFKAKARDWVLLDMAGVIDWIHQQYSPRALYLIGHSIGGQLAGMLDHAELVDGMITFSAQSGHWRLQGGEQKAVVAFHVHVTLPLLSMVFGYMPWSKFGAEDLPQGVAMEWSRWCRDRRYVLGDASLPLERYAQFKAPVLAYSFDDDKWGTPEAVDAMMRAYPHLERRHIIPQEVGLGRIAHFGFFNQSSSSLWVEVIEWLNTNTALKQHAS